MLHYATLLLRVFLVASALTTAHGQIDWPVFGNDPGAARYSPLEQINMRNVSRLRPAWTFHSGAPGSEATPVVINGVMYLTQPSGVFALEPETGKLLWKYETEGAPALRGLGYWPGEGNTHPRLFTAVGDKLLAIDATTGKPAPGFGTEGLLDLKKGVLGGLPDAQLSLDSPPAIYKNLVITGSSNGEAPSIGAYGDLRAWDARNGELVWTFHIVPRPGEPGYETWPENAWKNRAGGNTWGFMTLDVERGLLFAPTGSPAADFYGADRVGDGLYGNTLLALDAATGKLKWHQQLVHHDIWDYDLAAAPALVDIRKGGKKIPAVAQITKMGLLFVFNRVTGEPLYGIEERPTPPSVVPGEKASATQPFPVKPPPLAKNTFREEEIYDRSPEHAAFCKDLYERNKMFIGAPYTPMPLENNVLIFPSTLGGGNWGGVSFDPSLGYMFTNVNNIGQFGHMEPRKDPKTGETTYIRTSEYGPYARFWNRENRVPCTNPPFGELVAVDGKTGDIAWKATLGTNELLEAEGVKNTGALNLGGSIATAGGLVFIAATNDSRFRAFESKTGRLLWETRIDANGHTVPITYLGKDDRQYVVIMAAGGGGFFGGLPADSLTAFALDNGKPHVELSAVGPVPKGPSAPKALPAGEAKALVETRCGKSCHGIDTVTSYRLNRTEWQAVVTTMVARGARGTPQEINTVIDYLATHFGR